MNDLKFAYRQLLKNPGFTAVTVFTLALGIGTISVVFSLIQGVLLTPPPYLKPEQIALMSIAKTNGQPSAMGCTAAQWLEWRKEAGSFEAMAGYVWTFDYLILPDGSESFRGLEVTPDYFKVIGTSPLLGRIAQESDASGDTAQGLKSGSTSSAGRAERRLLGGIAIIQISLTMALLVGAGLLIRSVDNLSRVRPGYETQKILTMNVTLPNWDGKKWHDFAVRSIAQISALPGVKNAAFGWGLPLTGDKWMGTATIEGQPDTGKLAEKVRASMRSVTPEYFDALGFRIVAGRGFRSSDNWNDWKNVTEPAPGETPSVCIINQAMAERYFPNANPIGKTLRQGPWPKRPSEIIGVVANSRTEALTAEAQPEIYRSFLQCPVFTKHLVVRAGSDVQPLIAAVQRELRAIDPTVAIEHIKTMEQIRRESVASQTFAMRLMAGFSVMGITLAMVGIYGVLSLSVGSRRREIAIRMAVGAQRGNILGLVLAQGMRLITAGLLIGVGAALIFSRLLSAFLFGVGPTDPATLIAVVLLFVMVAPLACWLPARRAARVDPMEALRYE